MRNEVKKREKPVHYLIIVRTAYPFFDEFILFFLFFFIISSFEEKPD